MMIKIVMIFFCIVFVFLWGALKVLYTLFYLILEVFKIFYTDDEIED